MNMTLNWNSMNNLWKMGWNSVKDLGWNMIIPFESRLEFNETRKLVWNSITPCAHAPNVPKKSPTNEALGPSLYNDASSEDFNFISHKPSL